MKVVCRDCGATFDDDLGWKECEACFANKIEAENYPPCPSCESLRAENAALKSELAGIRERVRELDAYYGDIARTMTAIIKADIATGGDPKYTVGRRDIADCVRTKLRELGLITEARDGE